MSSLADTLSDWTDIDVAAYQIAIALNLIPPPSPGDGPYGFGGRKHVFWTMNPLGNTLFQLIDQMVALGALEQHENDEQIVRWHPNYSPQEI